MDAGTYIPFTALGLGGAIGGNVLGAMMQGGGGAFGRTILGVVGGVAAGFLVHREAPEVFDQLSLLLSGPAGAHLSNLIVGGAGGAALVGFGALFMRARA